VFGLDLVTENVKIWQVKTNFKVVWTMSHKFLGFWNSLIAVYLIY
jgi:hypothetical protein